MEVRRLHDDFGVELVTDVLDMRPLAEAISDLVPSERVVRVRSLDVNEDAQLRLTSMLGRVIGRRVGRTARLVPHVRDERGGDLFSGRWHADQSWSSIDTWSMLSCVSAEADADRTQFIDTATALRRLDRGLLQSFDGATVLHDLTNSRRVRPAGEEAAPGPYRTVFRAATFVRRKARWMETRSTLVEPSQGSRLGTRHQLVDRCPVTGVSHLRVGDHAWLVSGMSEKESTVQLAALHEGLQAEPNVLSLRWKQGDLVVYDNRVVLHRRDVAREPAGRVLRRTLVATGPGAGRS